MKNFWLKSKALKEPKTSEFGQICSNCNTEMWPMNDAKTMMQGDPMCACSNGNANLDIFYNSQYVQGETLQVINPWPVDSDTTIYQVAHTPICPGTMAGVVYFNDSINYYKFIVDEMGNFLFHPLGNTPAAEPFDFTCYLGCKSGVLEFKYNGNLSYPIKVVVNYEYDTRGK